MIFLHSEHGSAENRSASSTLNNIFFHRLKLAHGSQLAKCINKSRKWEVTRWPPNLANQFDRNRRMHNIALHPSSEKIFFDCTKSTHQPELAKCIVMHIIESGKSKKILLFCNFSSIAVGGSRTYCIHYSK